MTKPTTMLTTKQAAARLNISIRRVRALIYAGRLPATKAGRDWLITEQDLADYTPRPAGRPRQKEDSNGAS